MGGSHRLTVEQMSTFLAASVELVTRSRENSCRCAIDTAVQQVAESSQRHGAPVPDSGDGHLRAIFDRLVEGGSKFKVRGSGLQKLGAWMEANVADSYCLCFSGPSSAAAHLQSHGARQ